MSGKSINERLDALEAKVGDDAPKTTRILVIQDKSGSMHSRRRETISGFNEYLEELQKDDSDEAFLTLVQFAVDYQILEESAPVASVEPLTNSTYSPGGGTALFDAVGRGVTSLEKELGRKERALVLIMTDGEENSSREYKQKDIKSLIADCEDTGRWTFVFLGAGKDAWSGGERIGMRRGQQVHYGEDGHSHSIAYSSLSGMTKNLRSSNEASFCRGGDEISRAMASAGADVEVADESEETTSKEKTTSGTRS